ncbi:hypothetical protein VUR80DRAFT_5837 [Thermomyces stellatus]
MALPIDTATFPGNRIEKSICETSSCECMGVSQDPHTHQARKDVKELIMVRAVEYRELGLGVINGLHPYGTCCYSPLSCTTTKRR